MNARKDDRVRGERPRWRNAAEDARDEYTSYRERDEDAEADPEAEREADLQPGPVQEKDAEETRTDRG